MPRRNAIQAQEWRLRRAIPGCLMRAMASRDTYQKVLLRACWIAGDETTLGHRLGVSPETVTTWLLGEAPIPTYVFLKAVDIVLAGSQNDTKRNRDFLRRVREYRRIGEEDAEQPQSPPKP